MSMTAALTAIPVVQSVIVAAIGIALVMLHHWRSGSVLIIVACAWLWLCATPTFAHWMQHNLARPYPPRAATLYPAADAIVLVGGGKTPPMHAPWNANVHPFTDTPLGFTLALYRAGRAPRIVISAGSYTLGRMVAMLRAQDVPAAAIQSAGNSLTTRQDGLLVSPILHRDGATRILLVTYGVHMPRSVAVFRQQGLQVVAAPSLDAPIPKRARPAWWPNRRALGLTQDCLHEYIGLVWYRLRGWAAY